ncbi:MAG: CapA family protein [Candidatus Binatus sp.]|uniref:CapA family protein n=1 Tax=Candidatus Binatus sp. TaxID=2811406 RepID=UPI002715F943|nr:CapA family protein [Candidatus Binatus sp.]MDO8433973.1 CapA family protein [Candidatus Binatus sp.]
MVGDVMLGRGVNEALRQVCPEYPWGDTLRHFHEADWRLCNLECVISDRGVPWRSTPKVFHFRSDARNIAVLTAAGIDAVSLANNHILDFGYDAMREMLELLDANHIKHAGAGLNHSRAFEPALSNVGGMTIALIALTDNEPQWEATADRAGLAYVPIDVADQRAQELFAMIGAAKQRDAVVIISAHWGPNWGYEPPKDHIRFAHRMIDEGADIIFGHSGHVFRGIELYRERPIIYCAGNFIDDYAIDEFERNDESFIYAIDLDDRVLPRSIRLSPTIIGDRQARMAGVRARSIAAKMQDLCTKLNTFAKWNDRDQRLEIRIG